MEDELAKAESFGGNVLIVGHIPPGYDEIINEENSTDIFYSN